MRPVLVTAGATRNRIDAMRYLSAFSSGGTGVWLASRLAGRAPVTLMGSAEALLRAGDDLAHVEFGSTRDLMARMERWVRDNPGGVVVHAAAVGDYEAAPFAGKISSGQDEIVIRLTPTPKIVDHVKGWDPGVTLISFKAAPPETDLASLERIARKQLDRTGSELVFANVLGRLGEDLLLVDRASARAFARREEALDALLAEIVAATAG